MGNLRHDSHAVTRGSLGVAARPVGQALHDAQRLVHRTVRRLPVQVRHGAHAAAFMFQFPVVKRILPVAHHDSSDCSRIRLAKSAIFIPWFMAYCCIARCASGSDRPFCRIRSAFARSTTSLLSPLRRGSRIRCS